VHESQTAGGAPGRKQSIAIFAALYCTTATIFQSSSYNDNGIRVDAAWKEGNLLPESSFKTAKA
jgi:hypothetical protein